MLILKTEQVIKSFEADNPISLIRCGDGEKVILDGFKNPDFIPTFKGQLGYLPTKHTAGEIQKILIQAITECDILGVPINHDGKGDDWEFVESTIDSLIPAATKKRCSVNIHLDLLESGGYGILLTGNPIAIIGCRNITEKLKVKFRTDKVDWFPIAPEMKFTTYNGDKHYPDQFNKVKDWMDTIPKESILLVGGGFTGKIYCNWWRDAGGKAMDIGSVIDEWSGYSTRGPERGRDKMKKDKYAL